MKHVNSSESRPLRVSGRCSRPLENLFPVPSSAHTLASEPSQTLIRKLKSINALKISRIIYDLTFCSSYWHIRATRGPSAARFCDGCCQESCSTSLLNLYDNMPAEKLKAASQTGRAFIHTYDSEVERGAEDAVQRADVSIKTPARFFFSQRQRPHTDCKCLLFHFDSLSQK